MKKSVTLPLLAAGLLLGSTLGSIHVAANTAFPQTGQQTWGPFEKYWNEHSGLAQFGYPRTSVYSAGKDYDAQWFERALLTYNPSHPDPYKVELQLLGNTVTAKRRGEAPFKSATAVSGATYFRETSHNLSGRLLQYWQTTGGLAVYGFPISEQFMETSKSDGKQYQVQYFERNRMELHPELAGTRFEVQLGLLGSEVLDAQGGPQAIAAMPKPQFYPAAGVNLPGGVVVTPGGSGTPEPTPTAFPSAPALPATSAAVLYSSDFSGDLSDWQQAALLAPADAVAPMWRTRGGLVEQIGDAHGEGTAEDAFLLLNRPQAVFGNFQAETYFRASSGEPIGMFFRSDAGNFYLLRVYGEARNSSPKAELLQVGPGKRAIVASAPSWAGYTRNQWQRLTLVASGSHITVSVDDVKVLQVDNATLTGGQIGLYAFATGVGKFDNFRITAP